MPPSSAAVLAVPENDILPPELWCQVIEYLRGDYNALYSCIQVCRRLRTIGGPLLPTDHVSFYNRQEISLAAQRRGSQWGGPAHVHIVGSGEKGKHGRAPHLGAFASILARKWRLVSSLSIECMEWKVGDTHPDIFRDLATWEGITYLNLCNVNFPTIATFGRLVFSLRGLKILDCTNVRFATQNFNAHLFPQRIINCAKLAQLKIGWGTHSVLDIVRFFSSTGASAKLCEVHLSNEETVDLCSENDLIQEMMSILYMAAEPRPGAQRRCHVIVGDRAAYCTLISLLMVASILRYLSWSKYDAILRDGNTSQS